jgi:hypothetical protein
LNGFLYSYSDTTITQDLNAVCWWITKGVAVGAGGTILFTEQGPQVLELHFVITSKYSSQNLYGVGSKDNLFIAVGDNGSILRSKMVKSWAGVTTTAITTRLNDVSMRMISGLLLVLLDRLSDLQTMD